MSLLVPHPLRPYFEAELRAAARAERAGNQAGAWHHLERAHVLGQRWAWAHTSVHGRMAGLALRQLDGREVLGQLPRIIFGFLGSLLGGVPIGNTGGANVPAEQPMPIPDDLQQLLRLVEPASSPTS